MRKTVFSLLVMFLVGTLTVQAEELTYSNGLIFGREPDNHETSVVTDGKSSTSVALYKVEGRRLEWALDRPHTVTHTILNTFAVTYFGLYVGEDLVYEGRNTGGSIRPLEHPVSGVTKVATYQKNSLVNSVKEFNVWGTPDVPPSDGSGGFSAVSYNLSRGINEIRPNLLVGNYTKPIKVNLTTILPEGYGERVL